MPACADFEISLHRQDDDGYRLELRFSQPESETDIRLPSPVQVQFDLDGLRALALDAAAYGRLLSQRLFANAEVQKLYRAEIDGLTKHLADFEKIKRFKLTEKPFGIESGELTPTLKVKRKFVMEKYADLIAAMSRG